MTWLCRARFCRIAIFVSCLVSWLLLAGSASAQLLKVEAGASDMVPTVGGSISLQTQGYEGYLGAGLLNGSFQLGTYAKTSIGPYQFTAGDQSFGINFPTDIFGGGEFLTARGLGATLPGNDPIFVFAGVTTLGAGTPLFQAFQNETPVALVFMDRAITPSFHFYSRNIISRRQTWIEGFDWIPRPWLKTGLSAGMGSNKPYFGASLDVLRYWYEIKAGYIQASSEFRRITTPSVFASEPDRENILASVKPYSTLAFTAGHENFLSPQGNLNARFLRASVDQFQSSFEVAKFRLGAGIFESHGPSGRTVSDGFTASRSITRNIDGSVSYYRNISGPRPRSSYLISTIREKISPKLSLLQVINRTAGNTTVLFGGSYTTNRISVSVDYQTLYMPFLSNPLVTGIGITLNLKLWRGIQLNGETFRSPDGRLRYTGSLSTLLTPNLHIAQGDDKRAPKMSDYVVRGHARDEHGSPIEGAAFLIGDELVYSNGAGEFLLRLKKAKPLAFTVVPEEFLTPLHFTVVSAPAQVVAAPEEFATDNLIVLRPVTNNRR
jgi:hypothetical protein